MSCNELLHNHPEVALFWALPRALLNSCRSLALTLLSSSPHNSKCHHLILTDPCALLWYPQGSPSDPLGSNHCRCVIHELSWHFMTCHVRSHTIKCWFQARNSSGILPWVETGEVFEYHPAPVANGNWIWTTFGNFSEFDILMNAYKSHRYGS